MDSLIRISSITRTAYRRFLKSALIMGCLMLVTAGCSDSARYQQEIDRLTAERDSIRCAAESSADDYNLLYGYIANIESVVDSIAIGEGMLVASGKKDAGISRAEMRERIERFGELLERQRRHIAALEDSLSRADNSAAHLLSLVASLRKQLDSKDRELATLRNNISNQKKTIAELQASFADALQTNDALEQKNDVLEQAMISQNEAANTGFVLIGSKKELTAKGIFRSGGFLRKSKVNYSAFDENIFTPVDIRTYRSIPVSGKKVTILTPVVEGSYSVSKTSDRQWLVNISSPADFWSISNFLVIQTD